jgi:serine/threonine protein kinase
VESDFSLTSLSSHNCELWFYLIQLDGVGIHKKVEQYIEKYPSLAFAVDTDGRVGMDMATLPNKIAILLKSDCPYSFLAQNDFAMWFSLLRMTAEDVDKKVFEYVQMYQELAEATDGDENTALNVATPENRIAIILGCRSPLVQVFENQYEAWFQLIQCSGIEEVEDVVAAYVEQFPELAYCRNSEGRLSIDVASPSNRDAMRTVFLWHGRFDVLSKYPDYGSDACVVYRAIDETEVDDKGIPCQVALKMFHSKAKLLALWDMARRDFSEQHVVPILDSFPPPGYDLTGFPEDVGGILTREICEGRDLLQKAEAEKLYCAVMPYTEKNLYTAMKRDGFGFHISADLHSNQVCADIFAQIAEAVDHMHSKGCIHGNLVPINIGRYDERWMLMDLSSSVNMGSPVMRNKRYSSAYIPPEAIVSDEMGCLSARSNVGYQGFAVSQEGKADKLDYLRAHPSFDVWALGCILYQMISPTSSQLFSGDIYDDVGGEDSLSTIKNWNQAQCTKKLAALNNSNPLAINLLECILQAEPERRPSTSRILCHPFVSNKPFTRLVGQPPEYDVYLCYRENHAGDASYAKYLHKLLGDRNVSVWWDKTCLLPNVDWKEGFSSGLANASIMVCLITRSAINNPDEAAYNFGSYSEDSAADNMLLQFRMALELVSAGLLDAVFPIFIGDDVSSMSGSAEGLPLPENRMFGKYVAASTLPRAVSTVVNAVESSLAECTMRECLGEPVHSMMTVSDALQHVVDFPGVMVEGDGFVAFKNAADALLSLRDQYRYQQQQVQQTKSYIYRQATDSTINSGSVTAGSVGGSPVLNKFSPAAAEPAVGSGIASQLNNLMNAQATDYNAFMAANSGNFFGAASASSTARSQGGDHRALRGSFQDGLLRAKQSSFKGSVSATGHVNRNDSDNPPVAVTGIRAGGVIPTIAPSIMSGSASINESHRPSLNADQFQAAIEAVNMTNMIADQRKEIALLKEQLEAARAQTNLPNQAVGSWVTPAGNAAGSPVKERQLEADCTTLRARVSTLESETEFLKLAIEAKDKEITGLKEPHLKEMNVLKEQLVLLSALEKEMKTMAEKNKILRRQANKEMKALRDQLTAQADENTKLKQLLAAAGVVAPGTPAIKTDVANGKKILLPSLQGNNTNGSSK